MGSKDLTDLVNRIRAGDEQAEAELIERYYRGMRVIIDKIIDNPTDAEDLVQDTLIIALQQIRQGSVQYPERLSGYISAIARRTAWAHLKKKKTENFINVDEVELPANESKDQLEELLRAEQANRVRQTISELRQERDRQILTRVFILGEEKHSICRDLRLSAEYFNGVIFRALERFGKLYEKRTRQELLKRSTKGG